MCVAPTSGMCGTWRESPLFARLSGSVWAILEYAWYPLLVFIATPYLLHTLGSEKYGHWMLLTAVVGFGTIMNVGTGAAAIKLVSVGRGREDGGYVEHIVRASLTIAVVGGCLIAALIFSVFWFAGDIFFERMGDRSLVRLTGSVAALLAWIEQIDNVFASALKGAEQFSRAASIEMVSKTLQIFAVVSVVAVWGTAAALYTALVMVALVRLIAKATIAGRFLAISSFRPAISKVAEILLYAKWGWLQGVGAMLFGVADRMLVGSFLGAANLAYYSIASQLAQQVHSLSAAGLSVLFPKVSRKLEHNASFSLWKIIKLTMVGNFLVSTSLALGLLVFGQQILLSWLGKAEADASIDILWCLTIAYWVLALNVVPHFILLGLGRMRFVAMSNLAAGIVMLVTIYALVNSYGLVGVGVARIGYGIVTLVNFLSLAEYVWRKHGEFAAKVK